MKSDIKLDNEKLILIGDQITVEGQEFLIPEGVLLNVKGPIGLQGIPTVKDLTLQGFQVSNVRGTSFDRRLFGSSFSGNFSGTTIRLDRSLVDLLRFLLSEVAELNQKIEELESNS